MSSLAKTYTKELLHEQKYLANWLPNNPLKLGDIGEFKDNCFIVKGNIKNHQVDFETENVNADTDFNYSSKGGVSINTKLSGSIAPLGGVLGEADAGNMVRIKIYVFQFKKFFQTSAIFNLVAIGKKQL